MGVHCCKPSANWQKRKGHKNKQKRKEKRKGHKDEQTIECSALQALTQPGGRERVARINKQ